MGFFKDLRDMKKMADEMTDSMGGRPTLRETVRDGKQMMGVAQQQLAQAQQMQALMNDPGARMGTALINAIRDTGMTINEDPVIEFQMNVTDADGSVYAVLHQQMVSRLRVPAMQPGATVQVRIDPADRSKVLIV
jgi:hypothetical protein